MLAQFNLKFTSLENSIKDFKIDSKLSSSSSLDKNEISFYC